MKNRAFTLIELLAVIVILALILVIAIPQINKVITDSKNGAFESDAKIVLSQLDTKSIDPTFDMTTVDVYNIGSKLGIKNDNYEEVMITEVDNEPYIVILGKGKWAGLVAYGSYKNITIESDNNYDTILDSISVGYNSAVGANRPHLAEGMTPVVWNAEESKWIAVKWNDSTWYDYSNQKWANAVTEDCTNPSDLSTCSMWVWIPRYVYKITSGFHSNTTGTVEVQFSMGTDDTRGGTVTLDTGTTSAASNNKWTNQPAFTFGSTELTGIWVAKFEATATEGIANGYTADNTCPITGDNVTTKTIKIIPNVASWRCIYIGNAFTAIRNMETKSIYGWYAADTLNVDGTFTTDDNNIDTHLMKNVEWGAVSYLSKSQYGQNTEEIYINNSQNYTTGCAGDTATASAYNGCQNTYNSTNGVKASTTGTIYGIYDMAGGAYEMVSTYIENSYADDSGASLINALDKYRNKYTPTTDNQANNYALTVNRKGEAIWETSSNINGAYSWFEDYSYMPYTTDVWFLRGGRFSTNTNGGIFRFSGTTGFNYTMSGFRPVLLAEEGL